MKVEKLKEMFEYYKQVTGDENPNWYVLSESGMRYEHKPPFSYLKIDEANQAVEVFRIENLAPSDGMETRMTAHMALGCDCMNGCGLLVGKKELKKVLKERFNETDDELINKLAYRLYPTNTSIK